MAYRLPMRQVSQLFADLPGLRISPGAIAKQFQRMGRWLDGQYDRLKVAIRAAGVVHADETGWRTNGRSGYLWTLTDPKHTLYHVDGSREGRVIAELLGKPSAARWSATSMPSMTSSKDRSRSAWCTCCGT